MDARGRPTSDAARLVEVHGTPIALSASIGICVAPVEGPTREELLSLADGAMYRAKAGGPGRYVFADQA